MLRRPTSRRQPKATPIIGVAVAVRPENVPRANGFWRRYAAGQITTLDEWRKSRALCLIENDPPDQNYERFAGMDIGAFDYSAPERLRWPSYFSSDKHFQHQQKADWQHVDKDVQIFAATLITVLRKQQIPLFCHSAFRTEDEQAALFSRGVTKTRWPRAAHCQGAAVDLVHSRYAWQLSRPEWAFIGKVGKDVLARINNNRLEKDRFQMEWGGDWKFYDPAHWEKVGWKDNVQRLRSLQPVRKTPSFILSNL